MLVLTVEIGQYFVRQVGLKGNAIGAQELITDEDVEQLRTRQREDLPGRPLVWRVALRNLVADLTGRNDLAVR